MYRDGIPENDQRVDGNIHKKVNYYGSKLPEFQQEQNAISWLSLEFSVFVT